MIEQHKLLIRSFTDLQAKKIGILGGTFDPPHNGHLQIAQEVRKKYQLDCIVFIPAKQNPLKLSGPVATDEQRLKMLELLLAEEDRVFVSDIEINGQGPSYSIDTLMNIKRQIDSSCQLYLILGTDNLFDQKDRQTSLPFWKEKSKVFEISKLIIVARADFEISKLEQVDRTLYTSKEWDEIINNILPLNLSISSTTIRASVHQRDFPSGIIPDCLLEYVKKNKIYLK